VETIGGINFGPIWGMSGVQNFFGEGYPFHTIYQRLFPKGFVFNGITFVAKTTTLEPREGNLPMQEDGITPQEWRPTCIILGPWQWLFGVMLNAVGLTGPGAQNLLSRGLWQQMTEPFMISFMSVEDTMLARLQEYEKFLKLLSAEVPNFRTAFGLQINLSCPNVKAGGKSDDTILEEGCGYLDPAARYIPYVPIVFKINTLVRPETAVKLSEHPRCYGICVSNTLPWSAMKQWQRALYFPSSIFTGKSPLDRFGGGGLSGKPLLPLVEQWIYAARWAGFTKHINAGGGILCAEDVSRLREADSISVGSVVALRPWRLREIRERACEIFT
jgi:dihydroorotate dehydrogenase